MTPKVGPGLTRKPVLWGRVCVRERTGPAGAALWRGRARRLRVFLALAVAALALSTDAAAQPPRDVIEALSRGENQQALQLLAPLLDQQPRNYALLTLRGIALSGVGQPDEALKSFRAALAGKPDYLAALQGAAEIEFQRKDPQAQTHLEKAIELQPDNPTAHTMLGVLAFERQGCPTAIRHFAKAAATKTENNLVLRQYGQCLFQTREAKSAVDVFRRLLKSDPTNAAVRFNLGLSLFEADLAPEAIDVLTPLIDDETAEPEVLSLVADAYHAVQRIPEALETLKRAIALYPKQERHYVDLANLCMEQEAHDLGLEILETGIKNIPASSRLHGMRGVIYAQLSKFAEAEAEFARATELDPGETSGRIGLSVTMQQTGRLEESIPLLREQAGKEPSDPVINTMLARALIQRGRLDQSEVAEARQALQRAIEADPAYTAAWVELGKLHLKTGAMDDAVSALERAVDQAPDERQAVYQLMLVLRKAGRPEEARALGKKVRTMLRRDQEEETKRTRFRLVKEAPPRE